MSDPESIKSVHIIVSGRVQAVGFRYFTRQAAQSAGVNGWVRNKPDGTVEIVAEGADRSMERFVAAIKEGSPFSRVENVDIRENETAEHFMSFEIRN
ncbi:acylphosphatase [Sporolactobacillus sp. THM7-7]|nr:acylphosphatase [Sporolactobacillus sp. THM7-7]